MQHPAVDSLAQMEQQEQLLRQQLLQLQQQQQQQQHFQQPSSPNSASSGGFLPGLGLLAGTAMLTGECSAHFCPC